MRAATIGPVRMSTIISPLPDTAKSALKTSAFKASAFKTPAQFDRASRRQFYLLRIGEMAALIVFLSFCAMWVQWQTASSGFYPVSGDFVSFWTAGELALEGHAADAYHEMPHFFKELALHGDTTRFYNAFFYPPFFMLLCAGFALLSYFPALCLWLGATLIGYAAALRGLLPKSLGKGANLWVLFLGYPAVMVNVGFGQNGFLSTGLLGGAAIWLDRRPELAGICFGCLSYKPQLGIIVPLALAIARRWRVFATATATVVVLVAISTLAFGIDIWPAFFADMGVAKRNWLEAPIPAYLQFLITVFGAVRLYGGSLLLAYALQTAVTVIAVIMLMSGLLMRPAGKRSGRAEGAAIAACVPLCSPFMLEYDLVILAVPMAWLLGESLRDGFRRGECVALVAAFFAPALVKITVFDNAMKLSAIAAAALLFVVVLRRMMSPAGTALSQESSPIGERAAAMA
jgi:alpha-1,2-mannosyltransferase